MPPLPIRALVTSLASLFALSASLAGHASAALIVVTEKQDVVADDGWCSLREAVTAANRNQASGRKPGECPAGDRSSPDVIQLRGGNYALKRLPIGEDRNAGGDLDVTESVIIESKGRRAVIRNAIGHPAILGDGDRLIHVDPRGKGGVDVTLVRLTLARGDVGCSGDRCATGGSAIEQGGSGSLTLDRCLVQRNAASCSGERCGSTVGGAAIQTLFGGALTLRKTNIKQNQGTCSGDRCALAGAAIAMSRDGGVELAPSAAPTMGALVFEGGAVARNRSWCEGKGCGAGRTIGVEASTIAVTGLRIKANETLCTGDDCWTRELVGLFGERDAQVAEVDLSDNIGRCLGDRCFSGAALIVAASETAALRGAQLRRNVSSCEGASCIVDIHHGIGSSATATAESVVVSGDGLTCLGAGCAVYGLLGGEAGGAIDLAGVTVESNWQSCEGIECAVGLVTGWRGASLQTLALRVAGNLSGCTGARCQAAMLVSLEGRDASSHASPALLENLLACSGDACRVGEGLLAGVDDGDLSLARPTIESNTVACGGRSCSTGALVALVATEKAALDEMRIARNATRCEGEGCAAAGILRLDAGASTLDSGVVTGNAASCAGIGCRVPAVVEIAPGNGTIARSSFSGNASRCDGDDCAAGPGGALRNRTRRLSITDTTFTGNETDGYGGAIFNDAGSELRLERTVLSENRAGLRGTMEFGGFGGAIYNSASGGKNGVLSIVGSSIRKNRALRNGGGILNKGVIAAFSGSVVAENSTGDCVNQGGAGCP